MTETKDPGTDAIVGYVLSHPRRVRVTIDPRQSIITLSSPDGAEIDIRGTPPSLAFAKAKLQLDEWDRPAPRRRIIRGNRKH